jgi:asparagine synthase (glutamine-hydrolysing)
MCGIAGFVDRRAAAGTQELEAIARAMADSIVHRGPDDGAVWADPEGGLGFGFRRLAIIDLSPAGRQPMLSASGRTAIVYNGEIYNAEVLRPALLARGITFRGHSDTEVLLEHFEAFGVERTLAALVGMFAIALWDRPSRTLWLARDRMGEKPLYLARMGGSVLFGSELRALRAHPAFRAEIDPAGLAAYARFGFLPHPLSIHRDVEMVAPGGLVTIAADGAITRGRYFDLAAVAAEAAGNAFTGGDDAAVEELDRLLRDAVSGCMASDVPLGAFLSGGIDSSTVVALMQAQSSRPIRTFSIGFPVDGFDEAPHARAVAKHLGTVHEELYFTERDMIDLIPSLPDIYDEPFADSSQLPTHMVSKIARRHVTVALSGDGGDETFAGYSRYGQIARLQRVAGPMTAVAGLGGKLAHALLNWPAFAPLRRAMPPVFRARLDRWSWRLGEMAGPHPFEASYRGLMSPGLAPERWLMSPAERVDAIWRGAVAERFPAPIARAQMLDSLTYLPDDIMTKVDRASMAISLETRAPLLDHRVVRFAWSLPADMRIRDGETKWVLKRVLDRYVPRALVDRPKMGFGVPIDHWLRGPLRGWAEELLEPSRLAADGFFKPGVVGHLWRRHLDGEQWQYPLWVVLMFQAWRARWPG